MRALPLIGAALALNALTGCGFATGSMVGAALFGDEELFYGPDYAEMDAMSGWAGDGVACLGSDSPAFEPDAGYYEITGRVVADRESTQDIGNLVPCALNPARVLTVEDEDGNLVQLGYAWFDYAGWDATPSTGADVGEAVTIVLRQGSAEGSMAAGFALFDRNDDLLYALEAGHGETALENGDIPSLDWSKGDVVGSSPVECGQRHAFTLNFESATDRLTLYEYEDAGMEVDGDYFVTCSIASHDFDDDCEDVGQASWVMFR